jgi:NADH-quinone oxidoreductase subunit L
MTAICILLFIGAMGKSAQVPLHVWLPDSMEGPTPISALIHAATMVTAGIFMVARMSPLFELSDTALSFVIVIGAITALFMGFLGIIQNDIKRVVAYSTLSQLGYMTVALACFGLFGGDLPPDDARLLQGAAVPRRRFGDHRHAPRSGHPQHGRPAQVHADHLDHLADRFAGADRHAVLRRLLFQGLDHRGGACRTSRAPVFAYFAVMAGVFVTAFYSFRMYFLVFHGEERFGKRRTP